MASETGIFNAALIEMGSDVVIDPMEDSEQARTLSVRWPGVRDATLRAHPWNFALERAQLAALAQAPVWGFANQYQLPADPFCLRVLKVKDSEDIDWKVEGRKIKTDLGAPLNILYIKRVTDPNEYDALFIEAAAARLAAATAFRIMQSRTAAKDLWELYRDKLREAREIDAHEGTPDDFGDSDFLVARD